MFKEVNQRQSFPKMEENILKFWEENQIFEKSVKQRENNEKFVFFDGPPFANGLPHYGHILANVLKDSVTRYWAMKGYHVPRTNGWDCHGLPVEYEIEKELNLSGRKEVVEFGTENFNNMCRNSVFKYTSEWKGTLNRIGRWVNMENSYATLDNNYMESIWHVFKQIWDKDLIYNGHKSMHICPRCETALSNFEVTQGYKDITDLSATAKFKLKDDALKAIDAENEEIYMLAWTTTPWTLPGNVALAMNAEIEYIKAKANKDEKTYIVAQELAEKVFGEEGFKNLGKINTKALENTSYEPVFQYYIDQKLEGKLYTIQLADFVTTESGTGIVHIAPMFGEDDYALGRAKGLANIQHVGFDGTFNKEITEFAGKFVKNQDQNIAKYLKEKDLLFSTQNIKHSYPHCWRCDTPLLNYSTKSLFIEVTKVKEQLIANNEKIHWQPGHLQKGRFGKWLEGARDWAISRNRFWGCAIPLWECTKCDHKTCIGSIEELKEKSGGKLPMRDGKVDLHKPYIDEIEIKCEKCNANMKRISDVLDCWFESGSMPYAQLHYPFENKEIFENNFPANFIAEGLDQTRGWFYTLHVISTILFDKPAFKNVIVNGIILAEDGKKLSKRLKNYPAPEKIFNEKGVDSMRYLLLSSPAALADDVRFSEGHVDEVIKKFSLTLWNTYSFFVTYANIDKFEPSNDFENFTPSNKLDKWILSELNSLIETTTKQMDTYNIPRAIRPMSKFLDNLSNWYIRRSRRRFWKSENDGAKMEAYQTLYTVLVQFSKILAPFMPFISEEIFKNLTQKDSVHLENWPIADKSKINGQLNKEIETLRTIVNLGHAVRGHANIKVRQPLSEVQIALPENIDESVITSQQSVILEELNVKTLKIIKEANEIAETFVIPNPKVLGPKYGANVQHIIKAIKTGDFTLNSDGTVNVLEYTLDKTEVETGFKGKEGLDAQSENGLVVALNTEITPELKEEGLIRDIIRQIQELRKAADYKVDDKIKIQITANKETLNSITKFQDHIKTETLATEIQERGNMEADIEKTFEINSGEISIGLRK